MISEKVIIKNESGLHARPAGELTKVVKNMESEVMILHGDKVINPKSILNLMAAALKKDTEITVQCDGPTEKEDLAAVIAAINGGLGE